MSFSDVDWAKLGSGRDEHVVHDLLNRLKKNIEHQYYLPRHLRRDCHSVLSRALKIPQWANALNVERVLPLLHENTPTSLSISREDQKVICEALAKIETLLQQQKSTSTRRAGDESVCSSCNTDSGDDSSLSDSIDALCRDLNLMSLRKLSAAAKLVAASGQRLKKDVDVSLRGAGLAKFSAWFDTSGALHVQIVASHGKAAAVKAAIEKFVGGSFDDDGSIVFREESEAQSRQTVRDECVHAGC